MRNQLSEKLLQCQLVDYIRLLIKQLFVEALDEPLAIATPHHNLYVRSENQTAYPIRLSSGHVLRIKPNRSNDSSGDKWSACAWCKKFGIHTYFVTVIVLMCMGPDDGTDCFSNFHSAKLILHQVELGHIC